tara:strand:+ start:4084 stop:4497 length:414 start_codon:yes stop_codon:yes gene_type:complete
LTNKLSDKDKKDWQNFLDSSEKLQSKDSYQLNDKIISERSIDLHGYTLEEANKQISEFIYSCYINKVKKVNIITGKGMRSKNLEDPYQSKDLSILKYSVPEYIKNNVELMNKIIKIDFESVNSPAKGNFDIFLKTIK